MVYREGEGKDMVEYVPYVIEPSLGCDRVALAFLCEAYDEEVIDEAKAYWKDAREDVQTRTAEARERWNGMREELRETAQERSAEWKARHDSDPKE